jgi:hypothetical protein
MVPHGPKAAKPNARRSNLPTWRGESDSSDHEAATTVDVMPGYLKERKEAVERAKASIEETETPPDALRFPPNYDDIYFSDDERLVSDIFASLCSCAAELNT